MDWQARYEELLYEGESVRETVEAGSARVVVTTHRVLAFTPDDDGENVRVIDRPNVTGVETNTRGNRDLLYQGVRVGVGGFVLLVVGVTLNTGSFVPDNAIDTGGGTAAGIGGLLESLETLLRLFGLLGDVLAAVGVLLLLAAIVAGSVYRAQREPTVVISTAGGDDVHVPRPRDPGPAVTRLKRSLFGDHEDVAGDTDQQTDGIEQ